jgi:hypothetical protein
LTKTCQSLKKGIENRKKLFPIPFLTEQNSDFSRDLENLSPNLSPTRREALNSPHSLSGKGAGGLGFAFVFPHNVKSQNRIQSYRIQYEFYTTGR